MKKQIISIILCLFSICSFAQTKSIKDLYDSFKEYRTYNEDKAGQIAKTLTLLGRSAELTPKQVINVNYHLGRLYEEVNEVDKAIPYYEKSLAGEPNYEVIHRALGFIYLAKSTAAVEKINLAKKNSDVEGSKNALAEYKEIIQKAIPHLEKYQACDPDDETLTIITNLYKSLKDTKSIETLPTRLKELSAKCVTLLDDE